MKSFLFALFVVMGLGVQALAQSNCLNQDRAKALAQNFVWQEESQPGILSPLLSSELLSLQALCNRNKIETTVLESLMYMDYLTFADTPRDQFDQGILQDPVFAFFKNKVRTIVFVRRGVRCEGAANFTNSNGNRTVRICPGTTGTSAYSLFTLLLHEARHQDVGQHDICTRGPYIGARMCDYSYQHKGSYAVTIEAAVKIARNYQVPESARLAARREAYETAVWQFNVLPFQMRKGIALIDDNNDVYFYDGKTLEKHRHLKGPNFAWVQDEALKNSAIKNTLYDAAFSQGKLCTLSKTQTASCIENEKIIGTIQSDLIQEGSKFGRIQFLQKNNSVEQRLVVLSPDSGQVLLFAKDFNPSNSAVEKKTNPINFKDALVFDKTSYGLTPDGSVLQFTYWGDPATPVSLLKGKRFQRMLGPIYSSKDLEGI